MVKLRVEVHLPQFKGKNRSCENLSTTHYRFDSVGVVSIRISRKQELLEERAHALALEDRAHAPALEERAHAQALRQVG